MKITILFALVFCVAVQAAFAEEILITVTRDSFPSSYTFDDEKITVKEVAIQYLKDFHMDTNPKHLRMESHFGITYPLEKTLKDAGVKNGDTLKLKDYSRAEDIGSKILGSIKPPTSGLLI